MRTKHCGDCGETLPWDFFYPRERDADGSVRRVFATCRDCRRERVRAYAKANPDKIRAKKRRQQARMMADPERAAARRTYSRDWYRRKHGVRPEHYRGETRNLQPQGMVSAAPIREAVERIGATPSSIAHVLGMDESSIRRSLYERSGGMQTATAVRILGAVGLIPADVGF